MARVEKNLFIFNFKKLPRGFLLALAIILILYSIELFILPINFFSYRVFTSIIVNELKSVLPGHFYPNMKISMVEEGDLGHHTKLAIKKMVKWETDRYGYRKHDNGRINKYKIVIIGDSNIVGSGLTQQDILSEVLEQRLGVGVYPLTDTAIPPINVFLNSSRFIDNLPDVVIMGVVERYILKLPEVSLDNKSSRSPWLKRIIESYLRSNISLTIVLDRVYKNSICSLIKAGINRIKSAILERSRFLLTKKIENGESKKSTKMLFLQGMRANNDAPPEEMVGVVNIIKSYNQILRKKGIRFIFLPIPNKENIYYELLPSIKKPIFLEQLIQKLRNESIEVVDTQKAFEEARDKNLLLYHLDDTHWNENGVNLAADFIERLLKENRK